MAGISAINGLSGLSDTDLYYQYLINNNSTSTMLNAINANSSDNSTSALNSLGSLGALGSLSGLGTESTVQSFASVLQSYISTQAEKSASMADSLSDIIKQAEDEGDTSSVSYKTVKELYEYFKNESQTSASGILASLYGSNSAAASSKTSASDNAGSSMPDYSSSVEFDEFDFDELEKQLDASMQSSMSYTGINM